MVEKITHERWLIAQEAERKQHKMSLGEGIRHYEMAYKNNFRYLDIDTDLKNETIIEIGCADFPALRYCHNYKGFIVEPMASDFLEEFCKREKIMLNKTPFEELNLPEIHYGEIWMFNVLQHVIDPEKFISEAKRIMPVIRYFEPVYTEITNYHPHSFAVDDFERWFGKINRYYNETDIPCFHNGPCCYGVYRR